MRSAEAGRAVKAGRAMAGLLTLAILCGGPALAARQAAPAQPPSAASAVPVLVPMDEPAPGVSASAVAAAASAVKADPLLQGRETIYSLRLKQDKSAQKKREPEDGRWWSDLMNQLSWGLRLAVWLLVAAAAVWVLLRARDWLLTRERGTAPVNVAPTHVGSLDIRPESLPDDLGAAARALWQRGQPRAALSLLYRGALSRLVHEHGVPIRAASTERDCLALAGPRLAPASHAFLAQLVAGWQAVAYARRELPAEAFEQLCAHFDRHLDRPLAGGAAA